MKIWNGLPGMTDGVAGPAQSAHKATASHVEVNDAQSALPVRSVVLVQSEDGAAKHDRGCHFANRFVYHGESDQRAREHTWRTGSTASLAPSLVLVVDERNVFGDLDNTVLVQAQDRGRRGGHVALRAPVVGGGRLHDRKVTRSGKRRRFDRT